MKRTTRKNLRKSAAKTPRGRSNPAVDAVFRSYPKPIKTKLLALRRLILKTAATTEGVGKVEETLKWGQPSYLTPETKSGSTIRIDRVKSSASQYAVYFHVRPTWSKPSVNCTRRNSPMSATEASSSMPMKNLPNRRCATAWRWR
jgi:hypothetical protein